MLQNHAAVSQTMLSDNRVQPSIISVFTFECPAGALPTAALHAAQNAPVERESVLLGALAAVAAQQAALEHSQSAATAAVEAAMQVAERLIGLWLGFRSSRG